MAAYGCTNTSPLFVTGSSHTDFAALVRVDGTRNDLPTLAWNGANAFLNGGGNFRAYADNTKAVRYAVEVVAFVTGASPDVQVWVKIPSLTSAESIYFEADDTETTQPAVGAVGGRNAAWSTFEAVLHLNTTGYVDSTGNGHDGTITGTTAGIVSTAHPYGGDWLDFDQTGYLTLDNSSGMTDNSAFTMQYLGNFDALSNTNGVLGNWNGSLIDMTQGLSSGRTFSWDSGGSPTASTDLPTRSTATNYLSHFVTGASNATPYDNGAAGTAISGDNTDLVSARSYVIGAYNALTVSERANGRLGGVRFALSALSADWIATDHDNQFATTTQWTVGAWGLQASVTSATTGTAEPTQTEADVVTGGKTIILTLTGDTWAAAGTGPIGSTADTQSIIDGLDSAQVEATGWNNEVRDKEVTTAVVRTSSTVCTITLTASAAYDITATETITATIPAAVLVTSAIDVVSSPTWTVTAVGSSFQAAWARSANQVIQ